MRGYVAVTDNDWFDFLRAIEPPIDEVNFWRTKTQSFLAVQPGEPIFLKLKRPHSAIAGFGYFAHFSTLPISMAWDAFGDANGAAAYRGFRDKLTQIRAGLGIRTDPKEDFWIGCILINQPVFFEPDDWVPIPADFASPIQQGKTYDLSKGEGERIWIDCLARVARRRPLDTSRIGSRIADAPLSGGYGAPTTVRPRLGQRSFRIAVLDSYGRRCAITNEKTLPALEAAHIRDYRDVQEHTLNNGILFRADIHKLFDTGYVTVTPDFHFEVSRRIKEEFENGRDYYVLHGTSIRLPQRESEYPLAEALSWHNEQRFLG